MKLNPGRRSCWTSRHVVRTFCVTSSSDAKRQRRLSVCRRADIVVPVLVIGVCAANLCRGYYWMHHQHHQDQREQQQLPLQRHALGQESMPRLVDLIDGRHVRADANVSWLLDFAIIGFPKCGTTSIMRSLQAHSNVGMFDDERCDNSYNHQGRLVRDLLYLQQQQQQQHNVLPHPIIRLGLKCPADLENTALALPAYKRYFPHTKLLVGIRHPVLWFESFYNHRVHNKFPMPPPARLVGKCRKGMFNVCTARARFHVFLANLGKTSLSNPVELGLLGIAATALHPVPTTAPVFLYEVSQLADDENAERQAQFLYDLQAFLDLPQHLNGLQWHKPGMAYESERARQAAEKRKMDICHDQYASLRAILMTHAVNASAWIAQYFVAATGVTVSSRDYFVNTILPRWKVDPCNQRNKTAAVVVAPAG